MLQAGGVAVLRVGAATEVAMKEKKARVDDAMHATKAAVEGQSRVTIHTPLLRLTKAEIVRLGQSPGVDYSLTANPEEPIAMAVKNANNEAIIQAFAVAAFAKDGAPVIEVTRLFTGDLQEFSARQRIGATGVDASRTFIEHINAFPENLETEVTVTYTRTAGGAATAGGGRGGATGGPMKAGIGSAAIKMPNGLVVAAMVAVNAVGDIIDPWTGQVVAGARGADGKLLDARKLLRDGGGREGRAGENTTIGLVVTNAKLTKVQAQKMAQMAHDGYARAISPVHTPGDGVLKFIQPPVQGRQVFGLVTFTHEPPVWPADAGAPDPIGHPGDNIVQPGIRTASPRLVPVTAVRAAGHPLRTAVAVNIVMHHKPASTCHSPLARCPGQTPARRPW